MKSGRELGELSGGNLDSSGGSGGEVGQVRRHLGQTLNQGTGLNVGVKRWEAAKMTPGF